jgi:hypothetical protein
MMADILTQQRRASQALTCLSLFTSFGSLLCCALPSLMVLLGLGATVASLLSAVPWLVTLSRHKAWVFSVSGLMIGSNVLYVYLIAPRLQNDREACPAGGSNVCGSASRFGRIVLWVSLVIYVAGVFAAFVLGPLLMRFG